MAIASIVRGTSGIIILVVVSVVLLILIIYAIYAYIQNCKNVKKSYPRIGDDQKYALIDFPDAPTQKLGIKTNTIQPPYHANVKVKLIARPNNRRSIKYLDLSEEELEALKEEEEEGEEAAAAVEQEKILKADAPSSKNDIGQSIASYKEKITSFWRKRSTGNKDDSSTGSDDKIWKPDPVVISLDRRNSLSFNNLSRLKRPDSVLLNEQSFGRVTFILYYSAVEEYLTLLLIAGRQLNSCDSTYNIRLPAVSIIVENSPFSEVTSNPDEAPNPEYDQEFTFTIRPKDLYDISLRFTVWDIISNNETRVFGFFRVHLANYQKPLLDGSECGPICMEIQPHLSPPVETLGQVLVGLLYDCVTDKITVTVYQCKQLFIKEHDMDLYLKVSLLLDNDVITSKRSVSFEASTELTTDQTQTYEFSALSNELDKMTTAASPTLQVAEELLINASSNYKKSLIIDDVQSVRDTFASDTLRNHMGILISVRASTGNKNKRVLGRLYIGKTNVPCNDEQFHWNEMIRNFDSTIIQWHNLRLDRL